MLYHGAVEARYAVMDTSMKQRLLGAVVLIALAVIFVPMFLSGGNREPQSETVDLKIPPPPDAELQTRVLPVEVPSPAATTPSAARTEPQSPDTVVAHEDATPSSRLPVIDTGTATSAATPILEKTTATPPPVAAPVGAAADGKYLVHLGVYAQKGNATDLVAELKRGGFPAFDEVTDIDGKPARRVRVGPYADKAGAEAARLRIQRLRPSVPSSVVGVTRDQKHDAPAAAIASGQAGGWAVQLGAFSTESDANLLRDRARQAGFATYTDTVSSDGKTLWRVRAGPQAERVAADRMRAQIKTKLKIDGIIVTT